MTCPMAKKYAPFEKVALTLYHGKSIFARGFVDFCQIFIIFLSIRVRKATKKGTKCLFLCFLYQSPMNTASIRNPMEITKSIIWKRTVLLNHSAKLTSARPRPTSNVPQVG